MSSAIDLNMSVGEQYRQMAVAEAGQLKPLLANFIEDQQMCAYVDDRVKACEHIKQYIAREAWEHIMFLAGEQWSQWNDILGQMQPEQAADWQVRLVYNYTRQIVNQIAARLTENKPIPIVHPATQDEEDRDRARLCEKLLGHLWRIQKMGKRHFEYVLWMLATGLAIYKVQWRRDPQAEAFDNEQPDEAQAYALNRHGLKVMAEGRGGLPVAEVLSIFEFGWDPGAKDFEHCRWMYHVTDVHFDELVERYPDRGPHTSPNAPAARHQFSMQLLRSFHTTNKLSSPLRDRVKLIEYYELPSQRFPKGLFVVKADDVLLHVDGLPFGFLPFVTSRHNPTPGNPIGDGLVKDLKQPQRQVNIKESQRIENANLMASPKWLVAEGSVAGNYISDEPGEVVPYDANYPPPRAVSPPPLSPEHGNIAREAVQHMYELGGLNDLARGRIPAGMSGRSVGMFEDLAATILGPVARETEDAIGTVGMMWLKMYRRMAPPARTLSIAGKRKVSEVVIFHAEDITSTDVEVVAGSSLPRNRTHRREQVLLMYNSGVLGDPADPKVQRRVRQALDFDGLDEIYGDDSLDRDRAKDENLVLIAAHAGGQPFPLEVLPNDGHNEHCEEHDDFSKSDEFMMLSPEYKKAFLEHLAMHERYRFRAEQGIPWFAEVLQDVLPPEELAMYDPQFQQQAPPQAPPQEMPPGPPPQGMDPNMMVEQAMGPTPDPMAQQQGMSMPPELMAMMAEIQRQQQIQQTGIPEAMAGVNGPGVADFEGLS